MLAILAGAAAALALAAPAPVPTLDQAASLVAGRSVRVVCTVDPDAWAAEIDGRTLGYYDPADPGSIHLGPYACQALSDPRSPLFGGGLSILAHEAAHAGGVLDDEALAQCNALKATPKLARLFGLRGAALTGAVIAARRVDALLPPEYHGARC